MDNPILWIIVAIIVVLAIVALLAMLSSKKKKEQQRQEAAQMRERAAAQELQVKQREQDAEAAAAEAAQRRADADRAAAEARQAEQVASQKQSGAQSVRGEYDEHHRQADLIDPDVDTDKDGFRTDGTRPGGENALDGGTAGHAPADRAPADRAPADRDGARTDGARDDSLGRDDSADFGEQPARDNDSVGNRRDGDGPGWGTAAAGGAGALGAGAVAHQAGKRHDDDAVDARPGERDNSGIDLTDRDNDGDRLGDHDADRADAGFDGAPGGSDDRDRSMGDVTGDAHHGGYDEQGDPDTHFGDGLAGNSPRGHEGDLPARPQEPGLGGRHSYNEGAGDEHQPVQGHQHEGGLDGRHWNSEQPGQDAPVAGGYADESAQGWGQSGAVDGQGGGFADPNVDRGADVNGGAAQQNWDAPAGQQQPGGQPQGGFEQPAAPAADASHNPDLADGADWHAPDAQPHGEQNVVDDRSSYDGTSGDIGGGTEQDRPSQHGGQFDENGESGAQQGNEHRSIGDRIRALRDDLRGQDGS